MDDSRIFLADYFSASTTSGVF